MAGALRLPALRSATLRAGTRHCEPTCRANALPMTGSAKQSDVSTRKFWIASSRTLLATTAAVTLDPEISRLHLLVVGEFRAGAVHDHMAAFQHIGALHQRQRAADVLLDQQDRGAH